MRKLLVSLAMLPLATARRAMAFEATFAPSPQQGVAEPRLLLGENNGPPELTMTYSPDSPTPDDQITFTATASDPSSIGRIEILVNAQIVKTCTSSPCSYTGGPYPAGSLTYAASAYDTHGNPALTTGYQTLTVREAGEGAGPLLPPLPSPGGDDEPPLMAVGYSPSPPGDDDWITWIVTASDPSGIERIEIVVNQETVQSCPDSPCIYEGGPYPAGPIEYGAYAYDRHGNRAATGWRTLNVREAE